jgi:hypothetical protein
MTSVASNLDSVLQSRDGTMRPAGAAVLRDVLIQHGGAIIYSILVAPVEIIWIAAVWNRKVIVGGMFSRVSLQFEAHPDNFLI